MDSNGLSNAQPEERLERQLKQPKTSYTREFLLSLSGLEVCKQLPNGFDRSILRDFEDDASHVSQDRSRLPGRLPLQALRRNGYSSSPPGKGEMGKSPRGLYRWDSRSSERSDILSHSDKDADSWRRHGNQYRRPGHDAKHDGLLGSGSFVERIGYGPGASSPRFLGSDQHQLSRSNDPYHPPRPYKVAPHLWRENNGSCNDETFGCVESASEFMVEEERKRRAEFETMRNEQQKELREQLKLMSGDILKDDPLSELAASPDSKDAKMPNGFGNPVMKQMQQNGSHVVSVSSQGQPSRPCVPPGFANTTVQKISAPKFLGHSDPVQAQNTMTGDLGGPKHFQSLIVGERSGPTPETAIQQTMPPESDLVKMASAPSTIPGLSKPFYSETIPETISTVLTCEDLEQSLLSEFVESNSGSQPSCEMFGSLERKTGMPSSDIDDSASRHLLSLLQKGIGPNSKTTARQEPQIIRSVETQGNVRDATADTFTGEEKELTLQMVFGAAFMEELQSFDAPLSVQQHSERVEISCSSVDRAQTREEPSKLPSKMETKPGASGRPTDVRPPEDHILISLNDPQHSMKNRSSNGQDQVSPFLHGYSDMTNSEFPNPEMNAYSSSQLDQRRPMFHPFDPRAPLEGIVSHDDHSHHRFPANLGRSSYPRPNSRLHELDHSGFPITQQMQAPSNIPVTHLLPGFLGGPAFPPHFRMNPSSYIQLPNPDQGLPFVQRQANLGPLGMHLQGCGRGGISNGPRELFKRNMETEIRSNSKAMQPSLYGHELDAGFWQR